MLASTLRESTMITSLLRVFHLRMFGRYLKSIWYHGPCASLWVLLFTVHPF